MMSGVKITVKVKAFADAADNLFNRNVAPPPVDKGEGPVTILDFAEAFHFAVAFMSPQYANDFSQVKHDTSQKD
jgi:hypothetical protein